MLSGLYNFDPLDMVKQSSTEIRKYKSENSGWKVNVIFRDRKKLRSYFATFMFGISCLCFNIKILIFMNFDPWLHVKFDLILSWSSMFKFTPLGFHRGNRFCFFFIYYTLFFSFPIHSLCFGMCRTENRIKNTFICR